MASKRYSAQQVIDAIKGTGGIKVSIAAKLGCHRHTVTNYIRRYATVRRAYENERERMVDSAESEFFKLVRAGEWPAIRFMLMTLGASRGYAPQTGVDVTSGGERIKGYCIVSPDDWDAKDEQPD